MITSATSSTQIYSINQVTKTRATSVYSEATPTSPISRMEQMQEKYKDIYSPMPASYSKEREELQLEKIREVYPDAMSNSDAMQWIENNLISFKLGEIESQENKETNQANTNKLMDSLGGIDKFNESVLYTREMRDKYPVNKWAGISNSKELANFYNAAVYEGLENGKDLKTATGDAYSAMNHNIDTSELSQEIAYKPTDEEKVLIKIAKMRAESSFLIDLRDYGFNMQWDSFDNIEPNDKIMVSNIEKRLEMYDFMLKNPNIIDEKFQKINEVNNSAGQITSESMIFKPVMERMSRMELALDVFKKYKIFDSIDIKA